MASCDDFPAIRLALEDICPSYDEGLKVSRYRRPAERPSLTWRGDSIVLGTRVPRWATRIWLSDEKTSQRIGFANLRPVNQIWSIANDTTIPATAEAFLVPPERMRKPDYQIYPLSDIGALYGEKLAAATCFSRPCRQGGGLCGEACIFMCCVMLAHRGFRVPATHEISFLAAKRFRRLNGRDGTFRIKGLPFHPRTASLFSTPPIGGSALYETIPTGEGTAHEPARSLGYTVHQYLRHGLPVIMLVDCGKLYPEDLEKLKAKYLEEEGKKKTEFEHAVVIVGAHFGKEDQGLRLHPDGFVYHDPYRSPYMDVEIERLFRCGRFKHNAGGVYFIAPTPEGVHTGIQCVDYITRDVAAGGKLTPPEFGYPERREHLSLWDVTLVPQDQWEKRYFAGIDLSTDQRQHLNALAKALPDMMWAAEIYAHAEAMKTRKASAVWFFDATSHPPAAHAISRFFFAAIDRGSFQCWLPGTKPPPIFIQGTLPIPDRRPPL